MQSKPNILLIYTGGTIGMIKDFETGELKAFNFGKISNKIPELKLLDCTIQTISFDVPIDSSNMNPKKWIEIASIIEDNYSKFDGFVVLHGSDTMSYSASALSFMLENLDKPVIFTGSQLPIGDLRTDAKENLITVKHQLSMTTGLDDGVPDQDCTTPSCLMYKADAGTRWAYHNAPYHLVHDLMAVASGKTWNAYCKEKLFDKVGMPNAFWLNHIMYCTTREAARFGSLTLTRGVWNGVPVLTDPAFYTAMVNTSQTYNLSYGYLWWLNGKASSNCFSDQPCT